MTTREAAKVAKKVTKKEATKGGKKVTKGGKKGAEKVTKKETKKVKKGGKASPPLYRDAPQKWRQLDDFRSPQVRSEVDSP